MKLISRFTFLFVFASMALNATAQSLSGSFPDTMYRFVYEEAQRCALSTKNKDFKTLKHYTHPFVVGATGGHEEFLKLMEDTFKGLEAEGMSIDSCYAEMPSSQIVQEQGELRCILPNKVIIKMGSTKIVSHSFLMGFSFDDGKSWCFVEAEKIKDEASRKAFFPKLKTELEIPEDRMEMLKD